MNRLRELAKGYQYMRDEDGNSWVVFLAPSSTTPTTAIFWSYGAAPPECFADAKPAEERTLHSPGGEFVMKVWLKPRSIEAQILQQPEEWRDDGGTVKVIAPRGTLPRLAVHSYLSPYLFGHALVLRGRERDRDGVVFECRFETSSDRDAYLAKLEAAVAAMPRLADQFKVEDRVVVAGDVKPLSASMADFSPMMGWHGQVEKVRDDDKKRGLSWAHIHFDNGDWHTAYLINLRHKRDDERPAEFPKPPFLFNVGDQVFDRGGVRHTIRTGATWKPSYRDHPPLYQWWYETDDGCWRREKTLTKAEPKKPEPLRANFPPPQYHGGFPVLPIAEQEPKPPRKYEDGQHIKTMQTAVRGTIERAEWGFGDYGEWVYYLWPHNQGGDSRWTVQESACVPCPPPLSEAQRRLLPGDKVRVRKQRWDAEGKPIQPSIVHPPLVSAGAILRSWLEKEVGPVKCAVRFGMGEDVAEYLHNLDLEPAEEK